MDFFHFIRFFYSLYTKKDIPKYAKRCGPLAIKLLQFMIMRECLDIQECTFVFEDCEIHSLDYTKEMYFKDFGRKLEDDFVVSDSVIASGSIGQVYKMYSKEHGEIALKVKHPETENKIKKFIFIVKFLCWILPFKWNPVILEYIQTIKQQLNYQKEATNTMTLRNLWRSEKSVIVPEVYDFSDNFIFMEYIQGTNYNDLSESEKTKASLYIQFIILHSLLVHDFFHGDLHTGNWKVVKGEHMQIVMYDCGVICTTGNLEYNKNILSNIIAGSFDTLVYIISKEKNSKTDRVSKFIKDHRLSKSSDRIRFFINTMLTNKLIKDTQIIHVLSAFGLIGEICGKSTDIIGKYIGTDQLYESMIYTFIGLLHNLDIFGELKEFLKKWMNEDPIHEEVYCTWLYNTFGHRKREILDNIIYKKIKNVMN